MAAIQKRRVSVIIGAKTTEQLERAFVDEFDYQYLFKDGDGYTFMNGENFEQVTVPESVVGDYAPYLQENMTVHLSLYNGVPIAIELPQRVTLEVADEVDPLAAAVAASIYPAWRASRMNVVDALRAGR